MGVDVHCEVDCAVAGEQLGGFGVDAAAGQVCDEGMPQ